MSGVADAAAEPWDALTAQVEPRRQQQHHQTLPPPTSTHTHPKPTIGSSQAISRRSRCRRLQTRCARRRRSAPAGAPPPPAVSVEKSGWVGGPEGVDAAARACGVRMVNGAMRAPALLGQGTGGGGRARRPPGAPRAAPPRRKPPPARAARRLAAHRRLAPARRGRHLGGEFADAKVDDLVLPAARGGIARQGARAGVRHLQARRASAPRPRARTRGHAAMQRPAARAPPPRAPAARGCRPGSR